MIHIGSVIEPLIRIRVWDGSFGNGPHVLRSGSVQRTLAQMRAGNLSFADDAATAGYVFPDCMANPGFLHMYFGAFVIAVKAAEYWPDFDKLIRVLDEFVGTKGHADSLRSNPNTPRSLICALKRWSQIRFDVRWAKLEYPLDALLDVFSEFVTSQDMVADTFRPVHCKAYGIAKLF